MEEMERVKQEMVYSAILSSRQQPQPLTNAAPSDAMMQVLEKNVAMMEKVAGIVANQPLTLYQIESELAELLDLYDSTAATPLSMDFELVDREHALYTISNAIDEYVKREMRKVNGIARAVLMYDDYADTLRTRARELSQRAQVFENRSSRVKSSALEVMRQVLGDKGKLETAEHSLTVCGNGGLAPLIIDDEAKIPPTLKSVTVKMTLEMWEYLQKEYEGVEIGKASKPEISGAEVRKSIPEGAAHLGDRGFHLRVE